MIIVLLDGNKIKNSNDLHKAFIDNLPMPEWYGKNLDALSDILTTLREEIGIIAVNTDELQKNLGSYWKSFLLLMEDVRSERDNVHFTVSPFRE